MEYKKPQSTIIQGNVGIYPLTTADQVILADGTRLEKDGKINVDVANSANSAKLGGKAPEYYIQPRNLLDNSDFRNPVNQRAITSADVSAWTYSIDRWKVEDDTLTISVETDGIHLTASSRAWFAQWIQMSNNDVGKTFTLAYGLSDGSIIMASGTMPDASEWTEFITGANDAAQIRVACFENRKITVGFNPKSNLVIKWAALYEGSYTADTLPPYVPKGYAAELAECQRYFERIGQSGANRGNASMLMAVGNAGEMRVLQGYRVPKRIISPTIMVNGKAVGETVSVRNSMTDVSCTGVLSVWNNTCADRLNTLTVAGTSVVGAVYEGYLDIIADL